MMSSFIPANWSEHAHTYLSSEHTRKHVGQTLNGQSTHLLTITQILTNLRTLKQRRPKAKIGRKRADGLDENCHLLVLFITEGQVFRLYWTRSEDNFAAHRLSE